MFKPLTIVLTTLLLAFSTAFAFSAVRPVGAIKNTVPLDSLSERASLLAARGQVAELRPLYRRAGQSFPPSVRLYCEMALARADHRWAAVNSCIDSLTTAYQSSLELKGHIALSLLKLETLRRMGRYEELSTCASEQLAYFQGRRVKPALLVPFRDFVKKGRRLSGQSVRAQMLQKVDQADGYALRTYSLEQINGLDTYARLRFRHLLALAYNRQDVVAATADSLLFLKSDSLDGDDYVACVHAAAQAYMMQGRWSDLNHFSTKLMQRKKSKTLWQRYLLLSKTFAKHAQTRVQRPKGQTIAMDMEASWPLLVNVSLGDDYLPFCLSTGTAQTIITANDARQAHITMSTDTVDVTSPLGIIRAVTAVADSLVMGPVSVHDAVVYVAVENEGDSLDAEMVRTLGMIDLARLGCLKITDNALEISESSKESAWPPSDANLRFTTHGQLLFDEETNSRHHAWLLNTSFHENVAGSRYALSDENGAQSVLCNLSVGSFTLHGVLLQRSEGEVVDFDGVLGYPFIKELLPLTFDFGCGKLGVGQP